MKTIILIYLLVVVLPLTAQIEYEDLFPVNNKNEPDSLFEEIFNGLPYHLFRFIKSNGIETPYGKMLYSKKYNQNAVNLVVLKLIKTDDKTEMIWTGSNNFYNNLNGDIRNFYLDKTYCSFVFSSNYGLELIQCKKLKKGNWIEISRKFISMNKQEGFRVAIKVLLPKRNEVKIMVYDDNPALGKLIATHLYTIDKDNNIYKDGQIVQLKSNSFITERKKKRG